MPASLARIFIYPIKGLGGIELSECAVDLRGLRHDRRWMVTDPDGGFLTQRKFPRMALAAVRLAPGCLQIDAPEMPTLTAPLELPESAPVFSVQVWRSVCLAQAVGPEADAWFTAFLGMPARLAFMPEATRREVNPEHSAPGDIVSFADGYPVLAVGSSSLDDLNARLTAPLPFDRFRPNLVVAGTAAYAEDGWTRVDASGAAFRGAKPCERCVVTTIDQQTGAPSGPEPLRTLATYRRGGKGNAVHFGQNLLVDRTGWLRVGDELTVA